MDNANFSTEIITNKSTQVVFAAVCAVTKWWTENLQGRSHALDDEFSVRFGDIHYSRQRVSEFIPNKKVTWLVIDSNLAWLTDRSEWTNTTIHFDIFPQADKTVLRFSHLGLVPQVECYTNCVKGWEQFINSSLCNLIAEGKGQPDSKKQPA